MVIPDLRSSPVRLLSSKTPKRTTAFPGEGAVDINRAPEPVRRIIHPTWAVYLGF